MTLFHIILYKENGNRCISIRLKKNTIATHKGRSIFARLSRHTIIWIRQSRQYYWLNISRYVFTRDNAVVLRPRRCSFAPRCTAARRAIIPAALEHRCAEDMQTRIRKPRIRFSDTFNCVGFGVFVSLNCSIQWNF